MSSPSITQSGRFTKMSDELIGLGLAPRLVLLYGKLAFHAGKDGKCCPRHSTLAKEIGVTTRQHVHRLLKELRRLRLIEWKRGRYYNSFRVLAPDVTFMSHLMEHKCYISDVALKLHRKESSSKEVLKEPSPTPSPPGTGAEPPRVTSQGKPADDYRARPNGTQKPKLKVDDDDKTPKPDQNPEQEFRNRLRERHGPAFDTERCLKSIRKELEKGGVAIAEFVAYDAANTSAPDALRNPIGHYVQLAKTLRHAAMDTAFHFARERLRRAADAQPAEHERNRQGRCAQCQGTGKLAEGYCACPMGRDMEKVERRGKAEPVQGLAARRRALLLEARGLAKKKPGG